MIKPLRDGVLIRVDADKDKTDGGIYLPSDRLKDRPTEGIVEAIGETKQVKVGDRVLFVEHGHYELKDKAKIIVSEEDCLAVIE